MSEVKKLDAINYIKECLDKELEEYYNNRSQESFDIKDDKNIVDKK